ncbi:hypothetical protein GCM10025783_28020 [Amnibacterium soli]|uniref:Glycosyltransferase 2-like domain-containing protein n=2 Tax=Amnibacterium soli TaxID=1282736 RepID=A0ABP8ZDI0_9MICO
MNRPELLADALESIAASATRPAEVVVSDDSADDATEAMVGTRFPWVRYVRGPRAGGIAGNRNAIIDVATQPGIAFMDDDAQVTPDYFDEIAAILEDSPGAVVSGLVRNHLPDGRTVVETPGGVNFLGFPVVPWDAGTSNMLTMSATVFPADLFERTRFDPKLIYGFDEVDISRRASALGYPVLLRRSFVVDHFPQQAGEWYREYTNASRIYSTWNFYRHIQGRPLRAAAFVAVVVPHHLIVGALRRHGLRLAQARNDLRAALRLARA